MALAVASGHVGTFSPFTPPSDGPWDLPALQTLEDTAAQWAYGPATQAIDDQWAWVQQYWGGTTLPPVPRPAWHWDPWLLALLLVLGPRLVTVGIPAEQVIPWVEHQTSGRMPRRGPDGTPWPQRMREAIAPVVADVTARVESWAQDVMDRLTTLITGVKRAGLTAAKLQEGIADHFTDWGQDLQRLVQTELSAARADAILETATEVWAVVQTQPTACKTCHAAFDGQTFRILQHPPANPADHALTALWPGKWTLNWGKNAADQWPAVPRHPYCKCRVIPVQAPPVEKGWVEGYERRNRKQPGTHRVGGY